MKKMCIALFGALGIAASLPAAAGPDWQAIEQARKAKQSEDVTQVAQAAETTKKFVLPLDHGPRSETTPWLNQQRMQRFAAKAAAEVKVVEKK